MNVFRPLLGATLVSALSVPAIANAETEQHLYLNGSAGWQYFDDKRNLEEEPTVGVGIEYRFLPNWAVEAAYTEAFNADRKNGLPGEIDFQEARADGIYYFRTPAHVFDPYVALGVGHTQFDGLATGPDDLGADQEETRVNLGLGSRLNLTDMLSLRADLRGFHGIDDSTFDAMASLGLSLRFGRTTTEPTPPPPADSDSDGVADPSDQCPDTAMGTEVDAYGCELDSDNDGVANSADECPNTASGINVDSKGCEMDSDGDGVLDSKDQCPGTAAGAEVDTDGCEGVTETVETFTLNIQFPLNSAEIQDRYDSELRHVADFMEEHPETVVEIGGHSDSQGPAAYNEKLSQQRAESVAKRLTSVLGVDPDRVTAIGYGESRPVATNETASGRAENRRVEVNIQIDR